MGRSEKLLLHEIKIVDWIRDLIPARSVEEQQLLQEDIKANGLRTHLIITKRDNENILVDGHGRYEALKAIEAKTGKEKAYSCDRRNYENDQAITDDMLRIQLGRRNLSDKDKALLFAQIYESNKAKGISREDTASQLKTSTKTLTRAKNTKKAADIVENLDGGKKFIRHHATNITAIESIAEAAKSNLEIATEVIKTVQEIETPTKRSYAIKAKLSPKVKSQKKDNLSQNHKPELIELNTEQVKQLKIIAKDYSPPLGIQELVYQYIAEGVSNHEQSY